MRSPTKLISGGIVILLWQLILAAGVGLMFYFRRFLSWFGRKKADD